MAWVIMGVMVIEAMATVVMVATAAMVSGHPTGTGIHP